MGRLAVVRREVCGAGACPIMADPRVGPLEFVHFGLTAKYQLTTALARLRERGDREAAAKRWVVRLERTWSER